MKYEYKTVGAPEKGKRKRGLRSLSDRIAAAFEEILQNQAVDGWEYQRTDLLPVTENAGWFKRGQEVHRAVMVFRRLLDPAQQESVEVQRRAPSVTPTPVHTPEPEISADPDLRLAELVHGPGNPKPDN
jgi:hypothetical protein